MDAFPGICLAKLPEVTFSAGTVLDLAGNDLGALDTSASWLLGDFSEQKHMWHQQIWRNQPIKWASLGGIFGFL